MNKTENAELIRGVHELCHDLPESGKAERISLDNIYDGKASKNGTIVNKGKPENNGPTVKNGAAANHVMAFSTALIITMVVAQPFI